jgi:hypothetical protein
MIENFRRFQVGPDPFDRTWDVEFRWQQNGISIRHADTVDVKYHLFRDGDNDVQEKVIALSHPDLVKLCVTLNRALTDALVMKLAALHLREMILSDMDMDKRLITVTLDDMQRHARTLDQFVTSTVS